MRSRLDGFNAIARQYDALKKLVFGKSIYQSQVCFLDGIPRGGKVLIIGGGSGEILPALVALDAEADIWFVEASSEMLRIARKRLADGVGANVRFIHGTERALPEDILFDAVITHFFLDLFPDSTVRHLCKLFMSKLSANGVWLVSDFVDGRKIWQRFLLWVMYRFFAVTSGVEARKLPMWRYHIAAEGMAEALSRTFFGAFIKSALYVRKDMRPDE